MIERHADLYMMRQSPANFRCFTANAIFVQAHPVLLTAFAPFQAQQFLPQLWQSVANLILFEK